VGPNERRWHVRFGKAGLGERLSGDARETRSYYAYGKPVFAVADAKVVTARDGLPENVPGRFEAFHPAVPITIDTLGGNTITLDLGGGQFAHYFHLQPGSLRVKTGDHVRRGQSLAHIGASGDAREPHLHFEVTTSPTLLAGEGVPYLIDHFRLKSADGAWQPRTRELALDGMLIDFGPAAGH
jgi:murein DD-endopeptidase MepM/ murein hydrolase activator NlpD